MNFYGKCLLILLLFESVSCRTGILRENVEYYSNTWTIYISGDNNTVKKIAQSHGFEIIEQIENFPNLYYFLHPKHPKKSKYKNSKLTELLRKYKEVKWCEQVVAQKKEIKTISCPFASSLSKPPVNDILFPKQWYMSHQRCDVDNHGIPVYDMNVVRVWQNYKIFGKGVTVLVVDDGLEITHMDLKDNYDENFGIDLVDTDKNDPVPEQFAFHNFYHGTRVAGVITMKHGNEICGAGIAPMVKLGAVRLLGVGTPTDQQFHKALTFKIDEVDISNNSWGAPDNGTEMDIVTKLTATAFKDGINIGRNKKGIIYVFPAGNGKQNGDMCGYEALANLIYTIVVAGVGIDGRPTPFSERCACIMVTAYSGDLESNKKIITTEGGEGNRCYEKFVGTSASTPQVSSAIALVLEANFQLTWRQVHHLLAYTCEVAPLAKSKGWYQNGANFYLNHNFGFGMIDVYKMVEFAKTMEPVPPMNTCIIPIHMNGKGTFGRLKLLKIYVKTKACASLPSEINFMEHVQLVVNVNYPKRGAIKIDLVSPARTKSHLLESRKNDYYTYGLHDWTLDTIHFWGENPRGKYDYEGEVSHLTLVIHGTQIKPPHYEKPRIYEKFQEFKTEERLKKEKSRKKKKRKRSKKNKKKKKSKKRARKNTIDDM